MLYNPRELLPEVVPFLVCLYEWNACMQSSLFVMWVPDDLESRQGPHTELVILISAELDATVTQTSSDFQVRGMRCGETL